MANKPAHNSGKCRYLIGAIGSTEYCGKPTKYSMYEDEDGNKKRVHEVFCNTHRAKIMEMQESEEEF